MEDDTPLPELMFEIEVGMCERFPAMSPLSLRKERANDVFRLVAQFTEYAWKNTSNNGKQVIRRRAGDDWF